MVSQKGTTVAKSIAVKHDLPNKKQLSLTSIIPNCPQNSQDVSVLKDVAPGKFCLMNLFIDMCQPRP